MSDETPTPPPSTDELVEVLEAIGPKVTELLTSVPARDMYAAFNEYRYQVDDRKATDTQARIEVIAQLVAHELDINRKQHEHLLEAQRLLGDARWSL